MLFQFGDWCLMCSRDLFLDPKQALKTIKLGPGGNSSLKEGQQMSANAVPPMSRKNKAVDVLE
jgi:hypothetical protein